MDAEQRAIRQTENWVKSVIVELEFCPFARRELEKGSVRYRVIDSESLEVCLESVIDECIFLDENESTETTLLILSKSCAQFDDYLRLLDIAEKLIVDRDYAGTYQLASFHPDYIFSGSNNEDAANYTNRSPYPIFHIIREASIEKALQHYPDAELIPERNVVKARAIGLEGMAKKLSCCIHSDKKHNN